MAPPKPYKPVAVTLPQPYNDPSFEAFRKKLGEIASHKDRPRRSQCCIRGLLQGRQLYQCPTPGRSKFTDGRLYRSPPAV
jgi:hypothetical protein